MAYRIEQLPGEPLVIATLDSSFSVAKELESLSAEAIRILDGLEQVFYIIDVREVRVSFEDLVVGSSASARGAGSVLHHPNIREAIVVTGDKLIALSVKGLQSPVFGSVRASVAATVEEALAYSRGKMSAG